MALQAWQQLTGVNFIFYYGTTFFTASGIKNPFLTTIATNVVNVGMTVPGILAVDRIGRRKLLLWGAAGMCFCEYLVAILGVTLSKDNMSGQKSLVAFVCIYIVSSSIMCFLRPSNIRSGLLRFHLGTNCLGRHWRNFPAQHPCQGCRALRCLQLAAQLGYRLRHTLPRQPRCRECQSRCQGVLHLGFNMPGVLHLHLFLHP